MPVVPSDELAWRVERCSSALQVSRSKCYALIATGELPSIRIGHSIRVPVEALRRLIDERAAAAVRGSGREAEAKRT